MSSTDKNHIEKEPKPIGSFKDLRHQVARRISDWGQKCRAGCPDLRCQSKKYDLILFFFSCNIINCYIKFQLIQLIKQRDLLNARYAQRKAIFERLYEKYSELQVYKKPDKVNKVMVGPNAPAAPTTAEEEENRKKICHLENEILRTNAQWMEAEHIRKKYLSIKASLCGDAEKFERSLREMEASMAEQQSDVERIQVNIKKI